MSGAARLVRGACLAFALLASQLTAAAPAPVKTTLVPVTPGTVETRSTPFIAWYQDLSAVGYVEEEYLVSGAANLYEYVDDVGWRPDVRVRTAGVPYTTRILVRRPADPRRASGTLLVDVLNATAGWDGDAIWYGNYEYLIRSGAIWVGISTKPVTVNFLRDQWGRAPWPTRNATRYQALSMPAFGQVWDMLAQIGALLKAGDDPANPLRGFDVRQSILVGYSQSASYQVTFANSFHESTRLANGQPVFDGYFVAAGGATAKHVLGPPAAPENLVRGDPRNLVHVSAPVIRFQTQTEVVNFPAYPVRQTESKEPWIRTYELAGGSHVDLWRDVEGGRALTRDLGLPPSFCASPAVPKNPLHTAMFESAAIDNLVRWIADGTAPPPSRLMQLVAPGGTVALARDADGNVIGGVRPPQLSAPTGTYLESNSGPGFCTLYGGFRPFDAARLDELYGNRGRYVSAFRHAVNDSVKTRYLLREDGEALHREAVKTAPF